MLNWLLQFIRDILARIQRGPGRFNLEFVETEGKVLIMDPDIREPRRLWNVEKDRMRIAPTVKDRNGNDVPYTGPKPTWSSSDLSVLGLEVADDGMSAMVLTPLDQGEGTITVTAPGIRDLQQPFVYAPKEPGSFNPTFDEPESDL